MLFSIFGFIKCCSDIITSAAKSVSCLGEDQNAATDEPGYKNKSSRSCSLYDRWLEKYKNDNSTINAFITKMNANNVDGIQIPGMNRQLFVNNIND